MALVLAVPLACVADVWASPVSCRDRYTAGTAAMIADEESVRRSGCEDVIHFATLEHYVEEMRAPGTWGGGLVGS